MLIAVGLVSMAGPALADAPASEPDGDKALARQWADKAQARFDAGDYQGAHDAMEEAQKHMRPPTFSVFLARTDARLGRLLEAKALFTSVADLPVQPEEPPTWGAARKSAKEELTTLLPRIPQLYVTVSGAEAASSQVKLDGAPIHASRFETFFPVDPGKHTLSAEANGKTVHEELDVLEGTRHYVTITLTAEAPVLTTKQGEPGVTPSSTGSPLAKGGYVVLGVGGVGLVVGAVAGGLAIAGRDEARKSCGTDFDAQQRCASDAAGPLRDARTMAQVSTGAFVVGGVAAAAGVTLLLLSRKKDASVGVAVTPGFVMVRGAF